MGVNTTTAKVGQVLKKRRSSQVLGNRPLTRAAAAAATTAAKEGTSPSPILQPIPKVSIPSLSTEVMDTLAATAAATATAAADARAAGAAAVTGTSAPPLSYAAAAATPAAAPAPTQPSVPVIDLTADQSGDSQKASSGPKGTKRRLDMPDWEEGLAEYEVDDYASVLRSPPQVNHKHVVFASFKDAQHLPQSSDVILAAAHQFGHQVVAVDVFAASCQYALAFTLAKHADAAVTAGLHLDNDVIVPLTRRPQHRPVIEKVTVSDVDCTNPVAAGRHLAAYFGQFGRVLKVAPRVWAGTHILTGTWHVTVDIAARTKDTITEPPPPIVQLGGVEVIVDIPRMRRTCRVCRDTEHTNPACRVGQALARQGRQLQHQERQQQQQQQKQQKQSAKTAPRRWADQLTGKTVPTAPAPKPAQPAPKGPPKKDAAPNKNKGKGKGKNTGKDTPTPVPSPHPSRTNTPPPRRYFTAETEADDVDMETFSDVDSHIDPLSDTYISNQAGRLAADAEGAGSSEWATDGLTVTGYRAPGGTPPIRITTPPPTDPRNYFPSPDGKEL